MEIVCKIVDTHGTGSWGQVSSMRALWLPTLGSTYLTLCSWPDGLSAGGNSGGFFLRPPVNVFLLTLTKTVVGVFILTVLGSIPESWASGRTRYKLQLSNGLLVITFWSSRNG